ncbi:MAG: hypothetical protein JJT88_05365 [Gammaproteobacteria bacterium]|nr:hypothetical protein [Gammaproteobacteria bacterium]
MTAWMGTKGFLMAAAMLAAAGCAAVAGTTGISDSSRTGTVHDVRFEERMSPANLRVRVGDEVRWINHRSTPVRLQFLEDALGDVVCQSGFSSLLRRQQESATVKPNESASLCFGKADTIRYNARLDSPVAGGQMIESGTISVIQ